VIDNGSPQGSGLPGQGLKIIKALAKELDGEIVHRFGAEGAASLLMFPLNSKIQQIESDPWISDKDWRALGPAIYPS
jgi:hypothetical protein